MKLINLFIVLFLLSNIQSIHRKRIRKHRNNNMHVKDNKGNRRLKRRIKHRKQYVPLQQLNAATSLGFQQGIEFAKRQLNEHEEHGSHFMHSPAVGIGSTALLLGGIDRYQKGGQTQKLKHAAEQQFAMKDSVLSLVTKEIDNLGFVNQKIISLSRRATDIKNEITNKIQNEILYAYQSKKRELIK